MAELPRNVMQMAGSVWGEAGVVCLISAALAYELQHRGYLKLCRRRVDVLHSS